MMTIYAALEVDGRFERGQIVLDEPPALPEGTRLRVRIMVDSEKPKKEWPKDFFERTAGQADLSLERPPQGDYEVREPLE
ncbi:MAG: hypothetical protein FWD61_05970 [Phycisphaerales bacterium]|nr:hypothetical protein [Phycisphaerales bacterium]